MSRSYDLDPVARITAGAIGEPGERTFYVQAENSAMQVTLLAEKEQVSSLAQAIERMLEVLGDEENEAAPGEETLELAEPLDSAWRAGSMSIEYDEDRDRIAITIIEAVEEEAADEPATARFVASRSQARAMSEHAMEVVSQGRPRCQFCGEPLEADSHVCPAMNGHRKPAE